MWLAWVLLAMPTAWIVVGYQAASGTGEFLGVSQTSSLGGDGTSQIEPPSVSRLPQVFIALVLGLGNFGSTFELPLLGLAGAAGVAVLWVGQGRRAGVRAVSATGAVISLGLVFIGFGVVLSREPLSTSFSSVGMESMTVVDAQFAAWGLTGLFASSTMARCSGNLTVTATISTVGSRASASAPTHAHATVGPPLAPDRGPSAKAT